MAATIDEKVAEVALAFQTEADARLCDRTAGVLKENVKMERKLKDINTQVMGVVDANDRLKKKVLVVVVVGTASNSPLAPVPAGGAPTAPPRPVRAARSVNAHALTRALAHCRHS
jgi:hypothetical protein